MFGFPALMNLVADLPSFSGSRGSDSTTLDSLADVRFEGATVIGGRRKCRQRASPSDQPKCRCVNAGPHTRIATFESDQGGYGYAQTFGPGPLGFPTTDAGNSQVFTQGVQRL